MIILMVMVDVKLIMPTVLILLFTLFIMVTVIPYAFSSVIKQLRAVQALEELEAAGSDISKISPDSSSRSSNDQVLSETAARANIVINDTEPQQISTDSQ